MQPEKTYSKLWGSHYRNEWTTAVQVPILNLDSIAGGLTLVKQDTGREAKALLLKDKEGKQYILSTVDNDISAAVPPIAKGTFIEDIIKDQISITLPFAAVTIPIMAKAAGINHTNPKIFFVSYSKRLGEYNKTFDNTLCLLEDRLYDNEEDMPGSDHLTKVIGTKKLLEKLFGDNDSRVDQKTYVKTRLFDMFLGNWGQQEDQRQWAKADTGSRNLYEPISGDRAQAYTNFNGLFPHIIISGEELEHVPSFDNNIKNIKQYNFPALYLDRQLTNEVTKQTWIDLATALQQALTNSVIEDAIHQLPPELFNIAGVDIILKLKSRRDHLVELADTYYTFLSKRVDVVGTKKDELFKVDRINNEGRYYIENAIQTLFPESFQNY